MIKKEGSGYSVFSKKGKRLSKPTSKHEAHKRLAEIEWFKKHPNHKAVDSSSTYEHVAGIPDTAASLRKTMQLLGLNYKKFMGIE